MNHLCIFFIVLAGTIAVCASGYVSVARFPRRNEK